MENSFFEYREAGEASGSDSEVIDDSMVQSVPCSAKKKNHTVYIPESDDPSSCGEDNDVSLDNASKSIPRLSSAAVAIIASSEDDGSRQGLETASNNNLVVSSSEDEESGAYSPEIVPKRPPLRQKSIDANESILLRKNKKRLRILDSDTDNSIVIEQNKNKKHPCLKDTPLKIVSKNVNDTTMEDIESDVYESESEDNGESESEEINESGDEDQHSTPDKIKSSKHKQMTKTHKKMVITTDESDDDDSFNNIHKLSTNMRKTPKKLVISSDDSDEEETKQINVGKTSESHKSDHDYYSKNTKSLVTDDESDLVHDEHIQVQDSQSKNNEKSDVVHKEYENNYQVDDDDDDDDEGPDEDMMAMSRATRMSIMGIIPKDNDSDDSDYIQSDSSSRKTADNIAASFEDLATTFDNLENAIITDPKPDKNKNQTPKKEHQFAEDIPKENNKKTPKVDAIKYSDFEDPTNSDDSKISCSPFSSPLQDISNKSIDKNKLKQTKSEDKHDFMDLTIMPDLKPKKINEGVIDLCNVESKFPRKSVLDRSASVLTKKAVDDDVTIIETKTEVIALSSDDEEEVIEKPRLQTSKEKHDMTNMGTMKKYLVPASHPGQLIYVKKHVLQNETNSLHRLKEDLKNVQLILEELEPESLPDGGAKLRLRLRELERKVREQGDRVANMVIEPDNPTAEDIANDGLSWEDLQKVSNAVQPRMFGKQAMATHMAERNLILDSLRNLHSSLESRPAESTQAPQPALLRSTLLPYQRHALAWLRWRETQKPAAGILADDMGLGKTITMISLIASDKESRIDDEDSDEGTVKQHLARGGTLVVCPASLIQQWASEVGKHCTAHALSVCLHHGATRTTHTHTLARHDMVATTYNILQRDKEKNGVLMRIQWRRIILDEAHIVRNYKSATSLAVCQLKGRRRWCLTGTPVQNKDLDLFALMKFLRCAPFDDLQMWKKWIDNKSQGGQERLSTIMRSILLRRTKVQLQARGQLDSLPERTPHLLQVTLSKDEMNVYQKVLVLSKTLFAQFLRQRAEKNSNMTSFASHGKDTEYDKMHKKMIALQGVKPVKSHEILVLLLRLRQVCCHCGLVGSLIGEAAEPQPDTPAEDLLRELDKLSIEDSNKRKSQLPPEEAEEETEETAKADEAIRAVLAPNHPVFLLSRPSSKIHAVMDCLTQNVFTNKGDKAVVVSQWTSVLRLVEDELNKRKIKSVTLSGAVPVPARPRLIDLVNDPRSDVKVMLLSLCAGGVGINLCGANHLLLLDPHWNPQLEEQAQDRIYRLGQTKHVHIYRFMCVDTVEQTIRKLQEAKLQLAESVLTGARNTAASTLSIEDLKFLFNMNNS